MVRTAKTQIILETAQFIANEFNEDFTINHLIQAIIHDGSSDAYNILMEYGDLIAINSHETIIRLKNKSIKRQDTLSKELKLIETKIKYSSNTIIISPLSILKYVVSNETGCDYLESIGIFVDRLIIYLTKKTNSKQIEFINTPTLDKYSIDLTKEAKNGQLDPVIGRKNELSSLINALCRRIKSNAILIGHAGTGKTSIVEGLAQFIVDDKVPEMLRNKRIIALDLAALVAGTKFRGDFEERMQLIIKEIITAKNIILFIDEIHTMIGTGDSSHGNDAANILKPYLSKGKIQIIGATTTKEEREIFAKDGGLERRFQRILVQEPTEIETIEILKGITKKYEEHHSIIIDPEIIEKIVFLSSRYIHGGSFPDKAIDVLDQSCSDKKIMAVSNNPDIKLIENNIKQLKFDISEFMASDNVIEAANYMTKLHNIEKELEVKRAKLVTDVKGLRLNEKDLNKTVSRITGIPITELNSDNISKLKNIENLLKQEIISQDDAVTSVVKSIKRSQIGLRKEGQPIGSFLFLGPSGVGKTLMAKLLAKGLFGSEKNIKRFDMSEYSEHFTVSRLLGSPPGFVGYNEGGELVNAIKDNPYCILLFDEVEKAHPDIYDIFLQMMDDGRITDKLNRTVSLENCIIIMTSNIGSYEITKNNFGFITKNVDDKKNDVQQTIKSSLRKFFRPEFINRIGSTIIFNPLNRDDLSKIFELQIKEVKDNVKRLYNSTIIIDDSAKNQILNIVCEEKNNNARPMRKYIRDNIEDLLTDEVINNNGKLKNDLIIKYNDKFIINYKENKNVKIKRKDIKNNIQKCQNK